MTAKLPKLPVVYLANGAAKYVSMEGDIVGLLCCRHYGHEWNTTEAVFDVNKGLADCGPILPAGVVIYLPVVPDKAVSGSGVISLYDD